MHHEAALAIVGLPCAMSRALMMARMPYEPAEAKIMAEIRIDAAKAERMISQILRDERGLLPADANALAANICHRLSAAMTTPTNPPSAGYRIISKHPPRGDSAFNEAVAKKLAGATDQRWTANTLWELVYDQGDDLPQTD
jgi:hypothetical protein